jgi:hypothetical protein
MAAVVRVAANDTTAGGARDVDVSSPYYDLFFFSTLTNNNCFSHVDCVRPPPPKKVKSQSGQN